MNFYKHYIGDYQRDTGHLSLTEHGAYRLMLDAFYATGKPLPADKRALYRLVRAGSRQERLAVDSVAAQFWQADGGGLVNRRACVEIARAEKQAGVNRQIALAREERRRLQRQLAADGAAAGEDGGAAGDRDDAHGCSGVSEVCKVNDTQVIYGLQPFMVTNRVTSGCTGEDAATVARSCAAGVSDGVPDGGGSRFGCPAAESPAAGRAAGLRGVCRVPVGRLLRGVPGMRLPVRRCRWFFRRMPGGMVCRPVWTMGFRRGRWWGCCGVTGWWLRRRTRGCGRWWRRGWMGVCWRRLVWRRGGCVRMSGSGWLMWRGLWSGGCTMG